MSKEKIFVKKPKDGKALFFEVPSKSYPDKKYMVRVMPDGDVRCSCIANTMGSVCLHIKYFQNIYNEEQEKLIRDIKSEDLIEYKKALGPEEEITEIQGTPEAVPSKNTVVETKRGGSFAGDFPF